MVATLSPLIKEVIQSLSVSPKIKIEVSESLPNIYGIPVQITQVIQNLLSNAVKYIDKPDGLIRINCQDNADHWLFSITDNGPGIAEKYYEHIFKLFQTVLKSKLVVPI